MGCGDAMEASGRDKVGVAGEGCDCTCGGGGGAALDAGEGAASWGACRLSVSLMIFCKRWISMASCHAKQGREKEESERQQLRNADSFLFPALTC